MKCGVRHAERAEHPLAQHDIERGTRRASRQDTQHLRTGLVQSPLARLGQQRQLTEPRYPRIRVGHGTGLRRPEG